MKKIIAALGALLLVVVVFFSFQNKQQADLIKEYELDQLNQEQLIEEMEEYAFNNPNSELSGAVFGDRIELSDSKNSQTIELEGDMFYLSVAPYETSTHSWTNHSLTGCRGELVEEEMEVVVVTEDGKEIYRETQKTHRNGFTGVWLPREIKGNMTVNYKGLSSTVPIETYKNSNTCYTNLELR